MTTDLHTKYRPSTLDEVVGQDAVVSSLRDVIAKRSCRAFVFTGPSGTGKTTLARIVATEMGVLPNDLREIDAATHTGIDEWRDIMGGLRFAPMGKGKKKAVIVDEAHALSKASWQSLLKDVEEPANHVIWLFATTEGSKIPETIRTRCACYELSPVRQDDIQTLLESIVKAEVEAGVEAPGCPDTVGMVVRAAQGSPRRAITSLASCWNAKDKNEVALLLKTAGESAEVISICRGLLKGSLKWGDAVAICAELVGQSAESLRIVTQAYFTKVLLGTTDESKAPRVLTILEAFASPYPPSNDLAPYLLSLGRIFFEQTE